MGDDSPFPVTHSRVLPEVQSYRAINLVLFATIRHNPVSLEEV